MGLLKIKPSTPTIYTAMQASWNIDKNASTKACTEALTKTSKLITTNLNPMRTNENHNENQHEYQQNIMNMNEHQTGRLISNTSKNVPMPWFSCSLAWTTMPSDRRVMLSDREAWSGNSGAVRGHWRLENKMNWKGAPGGAPHIYMRVRHSFLRSAPMVRRLYTSVSRFCM